MIKTIFQIDYTTYIYIYSSNNKNTYFIYLKNKEPFISVSYFPSWHLFSLS